MMKARVKWVEDVCFMGEADSGHAVIMDASPEIGGRNLGMRPMELLLVGMGGCSSIDVVTILKKARQSITNCVAEISAERADEIPKVFTKIHVHFVVTGKGLNPVRYRDWETCCVVGERSVSLRRWVEKPAGDIRSANADVSNDKGCIS